MAPVECTGLNGVAVPPKRHRKSFKFVSKVLLLLRISQLFRAIPTNSLADTASACDNRDMPSRSNALVRTPLIDAASKGIIEQLQADGRRSYAEIGKAVGLSEAAVRQRVQKLTDSGVMQIVAVTDPMQLGFFRQAMIGIRASGDTRELADRLAAIPEIDYVVLSAGSFDVLVEVVCESDEGLLALVNDTIRPLPGVASTETFVYLRLHKQFYNWGTR